MNKDSLQMDCIAKNQAQPITSSMQVLETIASVPLEEVDDYSAGVQCWRNREYGNALKFFLKYVEGKETETQGRTIKKAQALYYLAAMYREGIGTTSDNDRSKHYLKRAADLGYDLAQLEYGELIFSCYMCSNDTDIKVRKEGWKYIESASDAGLLEAIKKYIELVITMGGTGKRIRRARKYILLIRKHLDPHEIPKYDEWSKELKQREILARKSTSYPRKYVMGKMIFLLGTIYLFKGLNPFFFSEIIPQIDRLFFDIPEVLILKWNGLLRLTEPYMTYQGIFGCWLIIVGNLFSGLGVKRIAAQMRRYKIIGRLTGVIIFSLCVIHLIANVYETTSIFGNGGYMQFASMIVCMLTGRMLGAIGYRILK